VLVALAALACAPACGSEVAAPLLPGDTPQSPQSTGDPAGTTGPASGDGSVGDANASGWASGPGDANSSARVDVGAKADTDATTGAPIITYGGAYTGGVYNLGPVDYDETAFHNACAPAGKYPAALRDLEGDLLAGLWNGITNVAAYCDACIYVETGAGKSALLRVVTYGVTTPNSIDLSSSAFAALSDGEYPRFMTWHLAKCPDTGPVVYEFQVASSEWWTSLWVRNARVPIAQIEVMSANHARYVALDRGSDGTATDAGGFGRGQFTIRLTGVDGKQITDTFAWPASGISAVTLTGHGNLE
jgi:expansin